MSKGKKKKKRNSIPKTYLKPQFCGHLDGYKNNIKINKHIWNSEWSRIIKDTPKKKGMKDLP